MEEHDDEIAETTFTKVEIPEEINESTYDFEMVLEYIGQKGRYQVLLASFMIYSAVLVGMNFMSSVFLLGVPHHRCHVPRIDGNLKYVNYTYMYLWNISSPASSDGYGGCSMIDYNYTDSHSDHVHVPCHGYVYSNDEFGETIVSEWNLICDRQIWGTAVNTAYFFGGVIGCVFVGSISDNIGRRYVLLSGTILAIASGLGCVFAHHLALVSLMRIILGIADTAILQVGFVYVTEIFGDKSQVVVGNLHNCFMAVGYSLLSATAFYWTNWRELQFVMTIALVPFVLMWTLMTESPRWLFAKGKNVEGKKVSLLIAKRNGMLIPGDIWSKTKHESQNAGGPQRDISVAYIFRGRRIREVTLIMIFCYFNAAIVYLGLSLHVATLAGGVYLNNALSGIADVIAGLCTMVILKRYGRRYPTAVTFICAGVSCVVSTVVKHYSADISWKMDFVGTGFAVWGKIAISMTYDIIYIYVAELYPTVVRASALSTCMIVSYIAFTVTPYVLHLQYQYFWIPEVIFGVLAVISGFVSLRLKETRDHQMMATLEEAENFYND